MCIVWNVEFSRKLFCGLQRRELEIRSRKINGIASCLTTKTIVSLIQFEAGIVVIVKGAACHAV